VFKPDKATSLLAIHCKQREA